MILLTMRNDYQVAYLQGLDKERSHESGVNKAEIAFILNHTTMCCDLTKDYTVCLLAKGVWMGE